MGRFSATFIAFWAMVSFLFGENAPPFVNECDRELQKTLEAIQAWRRTHGGQYPPRLAALRESRLLSSSGGVCPAVLAEYGRSLPAHGPASSVGEYGDPVGAYEYELSPLISSAMPSIGSFTGRRYTRHEIKVSLLRRPLWDQVPVLRCSYHRQLPGIAANESQPYRNITASGMVYSSGLLWEQNWLDEVPYCGRDCNVVFGLKGPPFHSENPPKLEGALDLRSWANSFGDHPWWWTFPVFDLPGRRQTTPHLRPFFNEYHGRVGEVAGEKWWIDGLIQLQGQISNKPDAVFAAPSRQTFPKKKQGVAVGALVSRASWLQGTVWVAQVGENVGSLEWVYSDGSTATVAITYGVNTARFWGDQEQVNSEKGFPLPIWSFHETPAETGQERWLRIYRQTWQNPEPKKKVDVLNFFSSPDSPASPFLIAVKIENP